MAARVFRAMESHPVRTVFAVALAVRAALAVLVYAFSGGSLFLDDESYSRLAEQAANGQNAGWDAYLDFLYERTGILLWPITGIYEVIGPVELGGQLYVALLGALAAALIVRLALEVVDARWALLAGLIVALLPSQVLWSSVIMKDAAVWALLAGIAVTVAVANRSTGWRLALLGALTALLCIALGYLRLHTLEVAVVAVATASVFGIREARVPRLAGAAAILLLVPLVFSMGVAGGTFVAGQSGALQEQRSNNAELAETPVAPPGDGEEALAGDGEEALAADISYLPTGLAVMALRPFPWESGSGSEGVKLARGESVLWYIVLAFALVGLTTIRGRMRALAFPLAAGGAIFVIYALTEGNLGTAFRHRGEFVGIVALLAALGAKRLWDARGKRRRAGEAAPA
ncbi:MAG: hypothetical protein H0V29_06270 [Thermoleophilaceae bacterium]|nr:hypothetical protein [Thermoleophilaceae bacterium]